MSDETMNLYDALREMRKSETPFSIELITYSRDRQTGGKRVTLNNILCAGQRDNSFDDVMQGFKSVDEPDKAARRCHIYSILYYNGKKLVE